MPSLRVGQEGTGQLPRRKEVDTLKGQEQTYKEVSRNFKFQIKEILKARGLQIDFHKSSYERSGELLLSSFRGYFLS